VLWFRATVFGVKAFKIWKRSNQTVNFAIDPQLDGLCGGERLIHSNRRKSEQVDIGCR